MPESIFLCNCSCHSWGGLEGLALSPPMSNIDPSTIGIKSYSFELRELKALSRLLEHQYLPYDDEELHEVVNKIFKIIHSNAKL